VFRTGKYLREGWAAIERAAVDNSVDEANAGSIKTILHLECSRACVPPPGRAIEPSFPLVSNSQRAAQTLVQSLPWGVPP
jgi:hypothetical protein